MLSRFFHAWEHRLASVSTDRVVRPFEWGLEWIPGDGDVTSPPAARLQRWVDSIMEDTDTFFAVPPTDEYRLEGERLAFPSAYTTPHVENNTVHARYFPTTATRPRRRAVVVLPQWNADSGGHVGLCRLLAKAGISALRLSLPYHDQRMPPEFTRADFIVSSNVARTVQVCRQAVLDTRRAIAWLSRSGYDDIGILGTSLGSCLAMLTAAHEPRLKVAALNHISPFFADVVWRGLSTRHVREGLEGHIDLELLRRLWLPISPQPYLERMRGARALLVYARYDLTFPVDLSKRLIDDFRALGIDSDVFGLPCGHYTTGVAPFSWLDGIVLTRFLSRNL